MNVMTATSTIQPVIRKKLSNGLTVLLNETHHAPVASLWIWYRVGSRNEKSGNTGISHWIEHMMFKGSPQFPAGSLDRLISREGGRWNAFTTNDFTAYYETLPAKKLDIALRLEADRMVGALMKEEEFEGERSVIISERQMYENHPSFLLQEALISKAFQVHPYRHEVIGDEIDLKSMNRVELLNYYHAHYTPGNAVAVAVGDFDSQEVFDRIEGLFGHIPRIEREDKPIAQEPAQDQERRVTVNGPGQTAYLALAYHAPHATDPDFYPLVLLNAALTGGSSLGFFGSGTTNKSSRLYKALVDSDLAAAVSGTLTPSIDPYLYTIFAVARPGRSLADIEAVLDKQIDLLKEKPVSEDELSKALKRAKAQFVMAGESVTGQAQMIGLAEMIAGDWRWYEQTLETIQQISLADINRVRDKYLLRENRVVASYEPAGLPKSQDIDAR